jgi:hypothetical protein
MDRVSFLGNRNGELVSRLHVANPSHAAQLCAWIRTSSNTALLRHNNNNNNAQAKAEQC